MHKNNESKTSRSLDSQCNAKGINSLLYKIVSFNELYLVFMSSVFMLNVGKRKHGFLFLRIGGD